MEAAKRRNDLALVADLQYEAIPAVKKRIQVQYFVLFGPNVSCIFLAVSICAFLMVMFVRPSGNARC